MRKRISFILAMLVLFIAVIAGCGAKQSKEHARVVRPVGPVREASAIRIYRPGEEIPPYRVVGPIRASAPTGASRAELNGRLRRKAAVLGADAVIDVCYSSEMASAAAGGLSCPKGQHECYRVAPNTTYRPKASGTAVLLESHLTE